MTFLGWMVILDMVLILAWFYIELVLLAGLPHK
jgi:hypothetical protein